MARIREADTAKRKARPKCVMAVNRGTAWERQCYIPALEGNPYCHRHTCPCGIGPNIHKHNSPTPAPKERD